jgi:transposase-like protein
MLSIAISEKRLDADLAAGVLACPGCGGRLSRWGYARSREVRMRDGVRSVTPRRALCAGCDATHVLSPLWSVPRQRDGAEVIGEALLLTVRGEGHRRIARRLGRPPGTVRGWVRAARARAESLRACGVRWAYALDPGELVAVTPAGSELGDAVEAIMLAARAHARYRSAVAAAAPTVSFRAPLNRTGQRSRSGLWLGVHR